MLLPNLCCVRASEDMIMTWLVLHVDVDELIWVAWHTSELCTNEQRCTGSQSQQTKTRISLCLLAPRLRALMEIIAFRIISLLLRDVSFDTSSTPVPSSGPQMVHCGFAPSPKFASCILLKRIIFLRDFGSWTSFCVSSLAS